MNTEKNKVNFEFKLILSGICFLLLPFLSLNAQQDSINTGAGKDGIRIIPCPRAVPKPILKKETFPKAEFKLLESQRRGLSKIGVETAVLKNGDHLKITNSGCEYYTLELEVTTTRFRNKKAEKFQFWYAQAQDVLALIADASTVPQFIKNGKKALTDYVKKNKHKLEDDINIQFGNPENYYKYVKLNEINESKTSHSYKIMISEGPL